MHADLHAGPQESRKSDTHQRTPACPRTYIHILASRALSMQLCSPSYATCSRLNAFKVDQRSFTLKDYVALNRVPPRRSVEIAITRFSFTSYPLFESYTYEGLEIDSEKHRKRFWSRNIPKKLLLFARKKLLHEAKGDTGHIINYMCEMLHPVPSRSVM